MTGTGVTLAPTPRLGPVTFRLLLLPVLAAVLWSGVCLACLLAIPGDAEQSQRQAVLRADRVASQMYSQSDPSDPMGTPQYGPPDVSTVRSDVRHVAQAGSVAVVSAFASGIYLAAYRRRRAEEESDG